MVDERFEPRPGIRLRCSGLRIQGTASSPPSTTVAMVRPRFGTVNQPTAAARLQQRHGSTKQGRLAALPVQMAQTAWCKVASGARTRHGDAVTSQMRAGEANSRAGAETSVPRSPSPVVRPQLTDRSGRFAPKASGRGLRAPRSPSYRSERSAESTSASLRPIYRRQNRRAMAEREGFEPSTGCPERHFQCRAIGL
jgi:hypothetical protein